MAALSWPWAPATALFGQWPANGPWLIAIHCWSLAFTCRDSKEYWRIQRGCNLDLSYFSSEIWPFSLTYNYWSMVNHEIDNHGLSTDIGHYQPLIVNMIINMIIDMITTIHSKLIAISSRPRTTALRLLLGDFQVLSGDVCIGPVWGPAAPETSSNHHGSTMKSSSNHHRTIICHHYPWFAIMNRIICQLTIICHELTIICQWFCHHWWTIS